ncbi:MAG TPA: hypothetical protein VGJ63_21715 [Micromonosporaceae bacterium]
MKGVDPAGTPRRDRDRADRLRTELLGPKRYATLSLDEVIQAGRILTGDPDGLSFYGFPPADWYARGIRLLGRTCVEATPDVTAAPIAETVRAVLGRRDGVGVIDPFAGSGNLMLHVAEALSAPARGLEADEAVWARTRENLRILDASAVVRLGDWLSYFDDPLPVEVAVYVLSPPWAGAFSFATGLDVTRTEPPIPSIVDTISVRDRSAHRFAVVQHTPVEPVLNLSAVTDRHPVVGAGQGSVVVRVR